MKSTYKVPYEQGREAKQNGYERKSPYMKNIYESYWYAGFDGVAFEEAKNISQEDYELRSANAELVEALKHLYHNAKKSGANMGLALDIARDTLAKYGKQET